MDFDDIQQTEPLTPDKEITCQDCGVTFLFTGRDQDFYRVHGYEHPKRCKPCRAKKKQKYAEREKYDNR